MQVLTLYLSTAAIFLAVDAVMLRLAIKPLFERHIGDMLRDNIQYAPAGLFYLAYVAGLCWLVSWPALQADAPGRALLNGAILGAVAYGTYEFTSFSVMKGWSWQMVAADTAWGTVLTAGSAWAGVMIARAVA